MMSHDACVMSIWSLYVQAEANYVHDIREMRITTHDVNYVCGVRDANFGHEAHDDHEVSNVWDANDDSFFKFHFIHDVHDVHIAEGTETDDLI
jgi:hypothetical protein